jgi:protective antigen
MVYKVIKKRFILQALIALGVSLTACVGDNQLQSTSTNKSQMQITKAQASTLDHGIVTYYFMDDSNIPTFSVPLMNTNTIEHSLAQYHNRVAKHLVAKFDLTVENSGTYQLSTSENGASISIDGALAANQSINFEAGKVYSIAVAYAPKNGIVKDLELRWLEPITKTITKIPTNNILFATTKSLSPKPILAKTSTTCNAFGLEDSSCNGIPDDWGIHGYTIYTNPNTGKIILERWDDTIHANNGYKKFFSAVYKFSTADDPYSDYEKVTGIGLDKGVALDARNPLVAAVPIIYAKSEGVIISKNTSTTTDINGSKGKSISVSTSNSATDGTSDDVGGSLAINPSVSIFPPSFSVNSTFSAKYDHQWNHSQTLTEGKDSTGSVNNGWSTSLNMNNADAAYFLPIMRYENIGTAPVYELAPTFTFVATKQKLLLNTVAAKSNAIANSLLPNASYPKAGQPGILISGSDDFNSQPAKLNKTQLDALEQNSIFDTYVNQFTAKVKFFNNSGQPINLPDRDNDWEAYLTQTSQTTTRIKLFMPDSKVKERKIAARDPSVPQENLSKPEVLLEDALAMIGLRHNLSTKKWETLDDTGKVAYELPEIEVFSEPTTIAEINKQLLALPGATKDIGKVKLRARMQLHICPKGIVVNKQNKAEIFWSSCRPFQKIGSEIDLNKHYYIKGYKQELYFDVWNVSNEDYAEVKGNSKGFLLQGNQQFKLVKNSEGAYNIIARHSGKALFIKFNSANDGANLIQHRTGGRIPITDHNASFDVFYEKGKLKFRARNSGKCLQSTGDRSNIQQYTCSNADSQLWELVDAQPSVPANFAANSVKIQNAYTQFFAGATVLPSGLMVLSQYNYPQKFNIKHVGEADGKPIFKIFVSLEPSLLWENNDNYINLQKASGASDSASTWWIYEIGDGTYSFMNAADPYKLLDLDTCSKNNYVRLKLQPYDFYCGNGDSRKWQIIQ